MQATNTLEEWRRKKRELNTAKARILELTRENNTLRAENQALQDKVDLFKRRLLREARRKERLRT